MSDAAPAPAPAKAAPKKKAAAKPKKPAAHPKFSEMIAQAITSLKERGGSSRQAILKYIVKNFKVDEKVANTHLKMALRAGVKNGSLKAVQGNRCLRQLQAGRDKESRQAKEGEEAKGSQTKEGQEVGQAQGKEAKE